VSATRTAPPRPAELADLEKAKAAEAAPAGAPEPDLAGYWSFDEADGDVVEDLSAKGRTAKLIGGRRGPGKVGGGLVCAAGGDRAEVEAGTAPEMKADYTVALWFRKEREADDWARLAGIGSKTERPFGLWEFPKDDKRLKFQIAGGGKWFDIDSTRTAPLGEWTHVAATLKGRRGALYVNGAPDGERDIDFEPSALKAPLTFGWYEEHPVFIGTIDEVRIYSRALSADEIRTLYEASK
jgi:hypothetical protein